MLNNVDSNSENLSSECSCANLDKSAEKKLQKPATSNMETVRKAKWKQHESQIAKNWALARIVRSQKIMRTQPKEFDH